MKFYKKKFFTKILVILFIIVFCLSMIDDIQIQADGIYGENRTLIDDLSSDRWAEPINCHTFILDNGNIQIIYRVFDYETSIQKLVVIEMNENQEMISQKDVPLPHTLWGGKILHGDDGCYYVAVGNDHCESESTIAFCFLKYDNNWNELGRCEITFEESFTVTPFDSSNCDMILSKDVLIAYVGRSRPDLHQSNDLFYINSKTMEKIYVGGSSSYNQVSHSFNQFLHHFTTFLK